MGFHDDVHDRGSRDYDEVDQNRAIDLAAWLFDAERRLPVVATTTDSDGIFPLEPVDLAKRLGAMARVVALDTGAPTRALAARLPQGFEIYGGHCRIWWPGMTVDDDMRHHPIIWLRPENRADRARIIEQRVRSFRPAPVAVPANGGVPDDEDATTSDAQPGPAAAPTGEISELRLRVENLEDDRDHALTELEQFEAENARLMALNHDLTRHNDLLRARLVAAGLDADTERGAWETDAQFIADVHRTIDSENLLTSHHAARLRTIRLNPRFLETARRVAASVADREQITKACARVAAGVAKYTPGAAAHPQSKNGKPGAQQMVRADGSRAWHCRISTRSGGPRLHYWVDSGVVEFAAVVTKGNETYFPK